MLYENDYQKLRTILDNYALKHPDYTNILDDDYNDEFTYMNEHHTEKIKFTTKLKKGQTYVYVIDNAGMLTIVNPYNTSFYDGSISCLWSGNYMEAYSFDLNIQFKK